MCQLYKTTSKNHSPNGIPGILILIDMSLYGKFGPDHEKKLFSVTLLRNLIRLKSYITFWLSLIDFRDMLRRIFLLSEQVMDWSKLSIMSATLKFLQVW